MYAVDECDFRRMPPKSRPGKMARMVTVIYTTTAFRRPENSQFIKKHYILSVKTTKLWIRENCDQGWIWKKNQHIGPPPICRRGSMVGSVDWGGICMVKSIDRGVRHAYVSWKTPWMPHGQSAPDFEMRIRNFLTTKTTNIQGSEFEKIDRKWYRVDQILK